MQTIPIDHQSIKQSLNEKQIPHSRCKRDNMKDFYWQNGYGAFSVQYYNVDKTYQYIVNQHIHHGEVTFETELRSLLRENDIAFDERFLWD